MYAFICIYIYILGSIETPSVNSSLVNRFPSVLRSPPPRSLPLPPSLFILLHLSLPCSLTQKHTNTNFQTRYHATLSHSEPVRVPNSHTLPFSVYITLCARTLFVFVHIYGLCIHTLFPVHMGEGARERGRGTSRVLTLDVRGGKESNERADEHDFFVSFLIR